MAGLAISAFNLCFPKQVDFPPCPPTAVTVSGGPHSRIREARQERRSWPIQRFDDTCPARTSPIKHRIASPFPLEPLPVGTLPRAAHLQPAG